MLRWVSVVLEAVVLTSGDTELLESSEVGMTGDSPTSDLGTACTIQYKEKLGCT